MARWVFLRHGQSRANLEGTLAGHLDSPLTDLGREQARRAGKALMADHFDVIVSSDLIRASETAQIVVGIRARSEPIVFDQQVRERSAGDFEGQYRTALREAGLFDVFLSWDIAPPNGESQRQLAMRASRALAAYVEQDTLIVCHGGVIRSLLGILDGVPTAQIGTTHVENAEPIERRIDPELWAELQRVTLEP